MPDTPNYDEENQRGAPPWPPLRFREDLAYGLSDFILDKGGKFQSLGPDSAITPDTRRSFATCINQYVNGYMDAPTSCGTMFHRYREQDPNDDPFTLIGASHGTNNPIAYPPRDGSAARDPGEQIRQLHKNPPPYREFNQSSFAAPRGNVIQQIQSATRAFEPSNSGSGNCVAGSGATSIDSHLESISKRRNREPSPLNENSYATTPGSHRSKRVDTQTGKDKKPEKKHECKKCGKKFHSPAHLRSHDQIKSHSPRGYRCKFCGTEFTREFSEKRHNIKPTPACMAARRASGASTLGSSSSVQSVSHVSAGSPLRAPDNAQDNMALSDGLTGLVPGNQQRQLVPQFHPPSRSPTNPPTACSRNRPSQPQAVAITQSLPSRPSAGSPRDPVPSNRRRLPVPKFHPPSRSPTDPPTTRSRSRPSQQQAVAITQSPPSRSLTGGSTGLALGNRQPPVLGSDPPSHTIPRATCRRSHSPQTVHIPYQRHDVAITQSPPSRPPGPASGSRQRLFYPPTPTNPRNTSRPTFSLLAAHAPSQSHDETIARSPPSPMLAGGSRHPALANRQPAGPGSYPSSPTNPRTDSRRNPAHIPSQPQDVAITQLPPGSPYGSIDPMVLDHPAGHLNYGGFLSP